MSLTKEVTGTWLVEETTRLYDLTIKEGGEIIAPEGKFVYMTVDGVGKDMKPGRYHGDIILSVAENYLMGPHALLRMSNTYMDFKDALVVDTTAGKVLEEKSVPAAIQGGNISGAEVDGAYIASSAESFNGILAIGDGSFAVKNTRIEMEGFGANDFVGMGAGVEAIDNVALTIEDCDIQISGVTRTAVHVGGDSHVYVKNSRLQNISPDSDWLGDFSWALAFTGTNRLCQLTDNGSVVYDGCHLKTNGWGICSIDGTQEHNEMLLKNSKLELSGPRANGYGAFCIGANHVRMENCDVRVDGYPLLLRGMSSKGRAEIVGSKVSGRRYGVMGVGDTHSVVTIEDSSFQTKSSTLVFKGSATEINVKNTSMVPGNGVIMQLMDNDEGGMNAKNFPVPVGEVDVPLEGQDLTSAGASDIILNLTDCDLTGDFYNSTTNIRANKRAEKGGMGDFHDAVLGVGGKPPANASKAAGSGAQAAEAPAGMPPMGAGGPPAGFPGGGFPGGAMPEGMPPMGAGGPPAGFPGGAPGGAPAGGPPAGFPGGGFPGGAPGGAPAGGPPSGGAPASFSMNAEDLDVPKNLAVTLKNTSITGVISSATQKYRDGLTVIDESNRLEMSNITQTAAPTVNNGVVVTLDEKSAWTATGTSYITKLVLADGAKIAAPAGKTVKMTVDGEEKTIAPGTYTGKIVVSVQ